MQYPKVRDHRSGHWSSKLFGKVAARWSREHTISKSMCLDMMIAFLEMKTLTHSSSAAPTADSVKGGWSSPTVFIMVFPYVVSYSCWAISKKWTSVQHRVEQPTGIRRFYGLSQYRVSIKRLVIRQAALIRPLWRDHYSTDAVVIIWVSSANKETFQAIHYLFRVVHISTQSSKAQSASSTYLMQFGFNNILAFSITRLDQALLESEL